MGEESESLASRRRRVGTYLMLMFTVGWIVTTVSIQFYQGFSRGYGTGFGDGGRVPPEFIRGAEAENESNLVPSQFALVKKRIERVDSTDPAAVVAATSHNAPEISLLEDIARLVFSLAVLTGITYFWYSVMSRVGTF